MARENIDVSKEGIKTSLLTFISDHATSLIMLAFLVTAYYFPIFDSPLNKYKNFSLSIENKIFLSILILLLLHPVGLLINLIGWTLLGWMEKSFETFHFKTKTFLTTGTKNYLCFNKLKTELRLTKDNFYETARQKEYFLTANHMDIISELDYALGTSRLLRNLTMCSIIIATIYFSMGHCLLGFSVLGIALFFIVMNSCISFLYSLSVLMFFTKLPVKTGT